MSIINFKIFVVNTVINTVNNQEINSMAYNPYSTSQPVNISDPSGRLSVEGDGMSSFNFPYTPTITNMSNANYTQVSPTHSNFQQQFFQSGSNATINVTAPIIIENVEQGQTILSALDFFRGAMKMRFGKNDEQRGLPPPVLRFNAHGVFQNIPVLVNNFVYNLDADVSYIDIESRTEQNPETVIQMPVSGTFVIDFLVTYSPKNVRDNFTLEKYLSGGLRGEGYV